MPARTLTQCCTRQIPGNKEQAMKNRLSKAPPQTAVDVIEISKETAVNTAGDAQGA